MNFQRFLDEVPRIHGDLYDFSEVTEEHVTNGVLSYVPVKCNRCGHHWESTISHLLYDEGGCKHCNSGIPMTIERFNKEIREVLSDKYDFSAVTSDNITDGVFSHIPVTCYKCELTWHPPITNFLYNKKAGCRNCRRSHGEIACTEYLQTNNINFIPEFRILLTERKRYDFTFAHNNINWVLEFDGVQHFKYSYFFHRTIEKFNYCQGIDISKTKTALDHGYHMIRIDHTQIDNISFHIEEAFRLNRKIYLSTPNLYEYFGQYYINLSLTDPSNNNSKKIMIKINK